VNFSAPIIRDTLKPLLEDLLGLYTFQTPLGELVTPAIYAGDPPSDVHAQGLEVVIALTPLETVTPLYGSDRLFEVQWRVSLRWWGGDLPTASDALVSGSALAAASRRIMFAWTPSPQPPTILPAVPALGNVDEIRLLLPERFFARKGS
jgi:hypothetical protein